MTVIISSPSSKLIVMVSDSVITLTLNEGASREYAPGRKFYPFDGIGCVTIWGRHNGNRIGLFLDKQRLSSPTHSVENLRELVVHYLEREFRPGEDEESEAVGYHVGGYDRSGKPRLFHIFWGRNRPAVSENEISDYHNYDHSSSPFLYNGRNDLAHTVVDKLVQQVLAGQAIRYDIRTPVGRVRFCDFVVRFAAEMTPEVGPPIAVNLIFPDNSIQTVFNKSFSPVEFDSLILDKLGPEYQSSVVTPHETSSPGSTDVFPPQEQIGNSGADHSGTVTYFQT